MIGGVSLVPVAGLAISVLTIALLVVALFHTNKYHRTAPVWLRAWFALIGSMLPVGIFLMLIGQRWGLVLCITGIPIVFSGISAIFSDYMDSNSPSVRLHRKPVRESDYLSRIIRHLTVWTLLSGCTVLSTWMISTLVDTSQSMFARPVFLLLLMAVLIGCIAPMAACSIRNNRTMSTVG